MFHENMRIHGKVDPNCMVGAALLIREVETSFYMDSFFHFSLRLADVGFGNFLYKFLFLLIIRCDVGPFPCTGLESL